VTEDSPPRLIDLPDHYAVERLLGRGGMASVYLATDLKHGRPVAVKVLDAELSQSVSSERFLREIRIVAGLTHPNILPLHDSGGSGGMLYYVMPYVEGETLRHRLKREGRLPVAEAVRIGCEVASALDYAHRQQVLHRDIKPENILLQDGHALVADFGIARALDASTDTSMTATGVAVGTPAYMSPEQVGGGGRLDARSDLYALACVLYEMLAGEPPFAGPTTAAVLFQRLAKPPPRIRSVRAEVPLELERVLLRGLERDPAARFASGGEFSRALDACARRGRGLGGGLASRRVLAGAVAVAVLVAGAAVRALGPGGDRVDFTTVAVLPLENRSRNPEHAYLAEGLTDALIGELANARNVRAVSSSSTMRFRTMSEAGMADSGGDMPAMAPGGMAFMESGAGGGSMTRPPGLDEIARELRADVLLQGTLVREGDSVRVEAALIRAPSLDLIWQSSYTRHVRELFALQRDLTVAVVAVVARGGARERSRADIGAVRRYDPDAHDSYLRGVYFQIHWKLPQAVEWFERAIDLDPTHAPAHASLARAFYFLAFFGDLPPGIALGRMRRAANAALEQDSLLAEAHAQLALVKMLQEWDWEGAESHFRRALEISPGNAQIRHDYAHFLLGQGRQHESAEQTRQAVALDPVNPMLISCLGWHSLFDARYEEAHQHALEANSMMPDHWAYIVLGWSLVGQGEVDPALVAFREARRLHETAFTLAALGHGLAVAGLEDEAREILDLLLGRMQDEYVSPYDIATVYAGLGEADETFRWLRRAAEERSTFIVHAGWDARFDPVRGDPRFVHLVTRDLRLPRPQFAAVAAADRRSL
jgi:eukaryotic-like serine/threonine-protein kinase